jgi:hypothetical protein
MTSWCARKDPEDQSPEKQHFVDFPLKTLENDDQWKCSSEDVGLHCADFLERRDRQLTCSDEEPEECYLLVLLLS